MFKVYLILIFPNKMDTKTQPFSEKGINPTKNKLKGTPFSTAEELKKAQQGILEETWRRLEKARTKQELIKKEDMPFLSVCRIRFKLLFYCPHLITTAIKRGDHYPLTVGKTLFVKTPDPVELLWNVSGLSIPSAKSFSWMKAGMSPSSEPFTLMERQRNQRRWAAKPAHQARGWGSCTAYFGTDVLLGGRQWP